MTDVPLPADVHPGRPVFIGVEFVAAPWQIGLGQVWIELFQVGGRSLAACGVAPLAVPIHVRTGAPSPAWSPPG